MAVCSQKRRATRRDLCVAAPEPMPWLCVAGVGPLIPLRSYARVMAYGLSRQGTAAAVVVALTVIGMTVGTVLLLATGREHVGWFMFLLSFGAWMFAAVAGMLLVWDSGYLDR